MSEITFKKGDLVKFTGCSREQIQWGNNDDPSNFLEIDNIYKVANVDIHSQHTKITLDGIPGRYNSVCFDTP
jgi:hypothetical protein